jgi:hypothetical protein
MPPEQNGQDRAERLREMPGDAVERALERGPPFSLAEIVDLLAQAAEAGRLDVACLMRITGRRGLGAMLLLPCLIILSPIGLLPGVPATMSLLMIVIALHMIVGVRRLWLPRRLGRVRFPQQTMRDGLRRMAPYAGRIDGMMTVRFAPIADSRIATLLAALSILAMSGLIMVFGFLPGLPALMALAVLFCGLGLAAHNSLFLITGYALSGAIAAGLGLVFWV